VHAALAGAKTYNIDMSKTYLNWALDNFKLNKINADRHEFIQANCLEWLRNASGKFDIILLDPPSFSNSKRMEETFDVQRDQEQLIDSAMRLLTNNGELYFSNNLRKFKLAESIKEKYLVTDITAQTIDEDFRRAKFAHHCYVIKLRPMV
jgi:23S rRNA (guanine2445-N2)-methyltransferase / 23S rRNA (guanine2069-N7)-methyltransferase